MAESVTELLRLLEPRSVSGGFECGPGADGSGRLLGGQVVGQALSAATRTVAAGRVPNSIHCSFLSAGRAHLPISLRVEETGEGRSYSRRMVTATQGEDRLLTMQASFHVPETAIAHHREAPTAPAPELCEPVTGPSAAGAEWPTVYRKWGCLDIRAAPKSLVGGQLASTGQTSVSQVWMRTTSDVQLPQRCHAIILACISDLTLIDAALSPHGISHLHTGYRVASLDHCLWLHDEFRVDDWLLYHQVSPIAGSGRGFCRGEFFQHGRHVATVVQESSIRQESARV